MVINAYIDESCAEPRTFALGCVLARGMDWFEISRKWKQVIDRKNRDLTRAGRTPLARYHSADCNNMQGEFSGWTAPERDAFLGDLISVLRKSRAHIAGNTVDLQDVAQNFPTRKPNPEPVAYCVLSVQLWKAIAAHARRIHRDPAITVVYERGPYNGIITDSYNALLVSDSPDRLLYTGGLRQENWTTTIPLQIADLVAYETMKETDRRQTGRDRRLSFAAMLEGTAGKGIHVPASALRRVAEGYWARVLPEILERASEL